MAYIRQIEPDDATGALRQAFDEVSSGRGGRVPPVLQIFSLNPEALRGLYGFANSVAFGGSSLGQIREELLATYISRLNNCAYCLSSHGEFLRAATRDDALVHAVQTGECEPELDPDNRAMLAFAGKLNDHPGAVCEADVDALRGAGFDDRNILDIVLVTGLYNLMNRVAEGLGVEPGAQFLEARARAEKRLFGEATAG